MCGKSNANCTMAVESMKAIKVLEHKKPGIQKEYRVFVQLQQLYIQKSFKFQAPLEAAPPLAPACSVCCVYWISKRREVGVTTVFLGSSSFRIPFS